MNYKQFISILLFACGISHFSFAQQTATAELSGTQELNNGEQLNAGLVCMRDTLQTNDSIIVIHTVCAPICSSHVRVYNKEWQYLGVLKAPFKSAFPEAYIENNKILWRDNDTFDYTPCR
ncbi:MAG: DUF3256 family protein [Paludibacteraceae bacterium]|nr:DUF3256 family protein [Paludibacteraceae bacterium]